MQAFLVPPLLFSVPTVLIITCLVLDLRSEETGKEKEKRKRERKKEKPKTYLHCKLY
jgi:hypothetical protein